MMVNDQNQVREDALSVSMENQVFLTSKRSFGTIFDSPRGKGIRPKDVMKKAGALGYETRNVSKYWLEPLELKTQDVVLNQTSNTSTSSPQNTLHSSLRYSTSRDFVQLSPHYGPGQNSPKELTSLRITRTLHHLGRAAIYSSSPYVQSALESLIPGSAVMQAPLMSPPTTSLTHGNLPERPLLGRLPRRGSKAAAMRRARRLVSAGAPFLPEVPFVDAVRVCNLAHDKSAMPALLKAYIFSQPNLSLNKLEFYADVLAIQPPLIQLQAAAQLLQEGYFFTAIKVVYSDLELLKATLEEMKLLVEVGTKEGDWEVAALTWGWKNIDKELFVGQFSGLRIISYYLDVRNQLRDLKDQGVVALAKVEREMLAKVVSDFMCQLDEDIAAQVEKMKKVREAKRMIEEERRGQEQVLAEQRARAAEEARVVAAAKAKVAAEERKQAAEDRARSYDEIRRKAAEQAEMEATAQRKAQKEREAAEIKAVLEAEEEEQRAEAERTRLQQAAAAAAAIAAAAYESEQAVAEAPEPDMETRLEHQVVLHEDVSSAAIDEGSAAPNFESQEDPPTDMVEAEPPSAEDKEVEEPVTEVETILENDGVALNKTGVEEASAPEPGVEAPSELLLRLSSAEALSDAAMVLMKAAEAVQASEHEDAAQITARAGVSGLGSASKDDAKQALLMAADTAADIAVALVAETDAKEEETACLASGLVGKALAAAMVNEKSSEEAVGVAAEAVAASIIANASRPGSRGLPMPSSDLSLLPPLHPLPPPSRGGLPPAPPAGLPPSRPASRQYMSSAGRMGMEALETAPVPGGSNLSAADAHGINATPPGTRPGTAGREGVDQGISDMRTQLSESRKLVEQAAEKMRTSFSRPGSARESSSDKGSTSAAAAAAAAQELEAAFQAQAKLLVEDQQNLAAAAISGGSIASPHGSPVGASADADLEQQQADLEAELASKSELLKQLELERAALQSAQSARSNSVASAGGVATPVGSDSGAKEEKLLKEVEMRLAAEEAAAKKLSEQREALDAERRALELERAALEQKNKEALNTQVTRSMQMFQQQLAQTVKMAALLQAQRIMSGVSGPALPNTTPSIDLPPEVDDPPSEDEILEYAKYLSIDTVADADLVYIAEWALTAPVPEGWTVHLDGEGHEFFHNNLTNASVYEHPMDQHYRRLYFQKKQEKQSTTESA
ncbi:hypothetical protein CEUSTIGMA_g994.t1 [Chlamydomonas eustigma]|uniref:WW domain-containing protein n=1 Tax=Chlamydomonas eustigma TaxID=1157962 RepID=A0A250WRW0_9CHLO|nr:hypothetical protein CEUSTIGMA_g994.t1 [Chlamydomonas eustigma]|eukprot:GAX73543.1 hypothetical protein CEUSTIGMA_g994.t1 [Chlamydomonas eustigma]